MNDCHFQGISREILANRYQIQKQLANKESKKTLLALDLQTQKLVVIKLFVFECKDFSPFNEEWHLKKNNLDSFFATSTTNSLTQDRSHKRIDSIENDLKNLKCEAETLKSLSHPAIPQYLDSFELEYANRKEFAIVQTYIKASSLEELLQTGKIFSEQEFKQIAKTVLEVLSYLYSRRSRIIHCDIKPNNILLTDRFSNNAETVYLVDFNLVQNLATEEDCITKVVNTHSCRSLFDGNITPDFDLYFLGAALTYLVTGKYPDDLQKINSNIELKCFAKISPSLIGWLNWMIESSSNKRLVSTQQVLQALELANCNFFVQKGS